MNNLEELRAKAQALRAEADASYARLKRMENEEWVPKLIKAQDAEEELQLLELREQIRAEIEAGKAAQ